MIKPFLTSLFLFLCAGAALNQPAQPSPVKNSFIFIVHGDGDYLFHDDKGNSFKADEEILKKIESTSALLKNSEVFIFHHKEKNYSFLFFPGDNQDFYYYKNGSLIIKESSERENFNFEDEISFYKKYSSGSKNIILSYYGHEIPEEEGYGYNSSSRGEPFNLSVFSEALKGFSGENKINLLILSTCNNGSPGTISRLYWQADYIIASPGNLHLSYLNPQYLTRFEEEYPFKDKVTGFAQSAFSELEQNVETAVTVSVYESGLLSQGFLSGYNTNREDEGNDITISEDCDCADIAGFDNEQAAKGVTALYSAPSFGKNKNKAGHSGWGCRKQVKYEPASLTEKIETLRD